MVVKRRKIIINEGDEPTPETKAKLKPDVMLRLVASGEPSEFLLASIEIRDVYEGLCCSLFSRGINFDPKTGHTRRKFRHPVETMPKHLAALYDARYKPWANEMSRIGKYGATPLSVVVDILIDGVTLTEVDRRLRIRSGEAKKILCLSLRQYCEMAGMMRVAA